MPSWASACCSWSSRWWRSETAWRSRGSITAAVDELFSGTERVKSGDFGRPIAVAVRRSAWPAGGVVQRHDGSHQGAAARTGRKAPAGRRAAHCARDPDVAAAAGAVRGRRAFRVAAMCEPAREVGGDYYDFLPLPDGRIGMLIADVSGKGTSAALYMAELKGLMLSLSRIHSSPRALLIEADRIISQHLDSRSFITMTYAVIDPAARTLTCARAGHCPFIRIPAAPGGERRAEVLAPDGMVLGLNLDAGERFRHCLEEISIPLATGDLFCFFTDGISEAMDGGGDCFGESRLVALLEENAERSPEAIRDRLVEEVATFVQGEPQHDDITMIILKIDG